MLVKKIDSACRATHRRYNWHSSRIVTFAANRVLTASDESNPDDIRRIRRRTALDSTTLRYPTQLCRAASWRLDHSVPSTRNVGVQLRRKPYDAHTGSRHGREKRRRDLVTMKRAPQFSLEKASVRMQMGRDGKYPDGKTWSSGEQAIERTGYRPNVSPLRVDDERMPTSATPIAICGC